MCRGSPAQNSNITSSSRRMRAIPGASSSSRCALRLARVAASLCITQVRVPAPFGTRRVAAGVRGSDQEDSGSPVGLAACHSEPHLPSGVRGFILTEIGVACARARDDLRRHGGREWAGCWAGLGVARAGGLDCDGRERIRKALLEYCGQDTLALARLVDTLRFSSETDDSQ